MSYLLDTHTFIWVISDREKLSSTVRQIIDNPNNLIFVSAVSFWEIALKYSISKLEIKGVTPDELPPLALKMGLEIIPLEPGESASSYKLPLTTHKDPFDRILIWQAIKRDYILISKDVRMGQYIRDGLEIIW